MVAMLPKLQDESGECDVTTQNQDVVKVPFSIDYYSEIFSFFGLSVSGERGYVDFCIMFNY